MESELSDILYNPSKIRSLITSLEVDAGNILLFLKHLESIEFHERKSGVTTKLLDIRITESYLASVRRHRQQFQKNMEDHFKDWKNKNSFSVIYPMIIQVAKTEDSLESVTSHSMTSHSMMISHYFAGLDDVGSMKLPDNARNVPEVGIALPVSSNHEDHFWMKDPAGHIFCFLPLPLEEKSPTGFQFHVHGCFSIDQNRRHLKWPSADQTIVTDDALIWNQFLVNSALPKAVVHLANYLITQSSSDFPGYSASELEDESSKDGIWENRDSLPQLVYYLLPDKSKITIHWQNMVENIFREVWKLPICYTLYEEGGRWLHYRKCYFDDVRHTCEKNLVVRSVLLAGKLNFSFLPSHLFEYLPHDRKLITMKLIRDILQQVQYTMELNDEARSYLLTFFLDGLANYTELIGLKLLPLADGSWTEFTPLSSTDRVYVGTKEHPRNLLPGLGGLFLRDDENYERLTLQGNHHDS